jgi:ketosteroid isomerase-like protein
MKIIVSACAAMLLMTGAATAANMAKREQQLIDLESAWAKAMVQKDAATVASFVADDWMGQNDSGKVEDKTHLIDALKSGKMSATSMTNRDVHVRIMRGMAIVQGAEDEKSSFKGKDTSGAYTWIDVFVKRDGKWQAIASQYTKVK